MPDSRFSVNARELRESRAQENRNVTDFLRDLVRGDRQRRGDAERHGRKDRGRDDRAVDERMERVADDHE